jgi:hypothetical protein
MIDLEYARNLGFNTAKTIINVYNGGSTNFPLTVCAVESILREDSKPKHFRTAVKGHGNDAEAVGEMVKLFRRGHSKFERMLGGPETKQKYWVPLAGGKSVRCDGFNVMEQRPFTDWELEEEE